LLPAAADPVRGRKLGSGRRAIRRESLGG